MIDYFGGDDRASNIEMIRKRAEEARGWVIDPYMRRKSDSIVVKYENLISRPVDTLTRVLEYTKLGICNDAAKNMISKAQKTQPDKHKKRHVTSGSPTSSVGRWENDLDATLKRVVQESFNDHLRTFGYK